MARLAPAACSSRAMAAPTRRAPPVISTVLPARLPCYPFTMHSMTSPASVSTLPALTCRGTRAFGARRGSHPRVHARRSGGVIGFDAYMRLALYAPGLGYYSAGATKIGSGGDFVTAPEVSSLFSRCLARQAADVLRDDRRRRARARARARVAWRPTCCSSWRRSMRCPERYRILEVSADLAERQRARIAQLPAELRSGSSG